MRVRSLCSTGLVLVLLAMSACKKASSDEAAQVAPTPTATSDAVAPQADAAGPPSDAPPAAKPAQASQAASVPLLAYAYAYVVKAPAARIHDLAAQDESACVQAGPLTCQIVAESERASDDRAASAHLELRATPVWIARFRGGLAGEAKAAGGRIDSAATTTDDLSRQIVDTGASIRAGAAVRERLQQLVADRTGKLSDVMDVERELARVQGQIDASQSELAVMQTRVAMSALKIDYLAFGVAAPDAGPSPMRQALNSFFDNMMGVFAGLLTFASFVLPIALVLSPLVWIGWRLARPRPAKRASPAT